MTVAIWLILISGIIYGVIVLHNVKRFNRNINSNIKSGRLNSNPILTDFSKRKLANSSENNSGFPASNAVNELPDKPYGDIIKNFTKRECGNNDKGRI